MRLYFFGKRSDLFRILQNLSAELLERMKKAMVQIKREWFDTEFGNYERGKTYGRWKEKIQV